MVATVCSALGCRGDECVLACAGISAGRRSLHSDVKGSTQRLAVSMVNDEISLWAAEPRETLECRQTVTCCRSAAANCRSIYHALRVCVIAGSHRCVFGHLSAAGSCELTIDGCIFQSLICSCVCNA